MKRFLFMMLALVIAVCAANLYSTEQKLESLEQNVIRLHIRANSDSLTDQTAKLRLRDAILPYAQEWLAGCDTQSERIAAMQQRLPEIRSLAESVLKEAGCSSSVSAEFGETAFPERTYGRYTLPAGNYQSLILTVGAGEGQNWWCLMYPEMRRSVPFNRQMDAGKVRSCRKKRILLLFSACFRLSFTQFPHSGFILISA